VAVPAKIIEDLTGWSGRGSGITDARAFLQERVALYAKILVGFLATFWIVARLASLSISYELFEEQATSPLSLIHLLLTIGLMLDYLYLRRGNRKLWILHAYESLGTVMFAAIVAYQLTLLPDEMPAMATLPVLILILMTRSAIVPSSAPRTFVVGIGATSLISVATFYTLEPGAHELDLFGREIQSGAMAFWGVVFSVASAIVSNVIYGLTETVRKALELGQYRLVEKLGEGGMGAVYRGEHALLKRPTAIKLLPPEKAGEAAVRRFEREVVQTSRLANPHTVAIYDFGRTPDGIFYYAMEYLEGIDLQDLVDIDGPQKPGRVVRILQEAAESLREAHTAGLIHRDVKPANVILCNRGGIADMVKVVDFGLVKEIGDIQDAGRSTTGAIAGTPLYLSPEAISDPEHMDGRADIYALGAVAYFLLTGVPVFDSENVVEVCAAHLHQPPIAPSLRLGAEIPEALEEVVLRCLAKDPDERFDANELLETLTDLDLEPWTDAQARAWWRSSKEVIAAHLEGKRAGAASLGPVTLALMRQSDSQAA
jgi:serine/threonine-protein kinase